MVVVASTVEQSTYRARSCSERCRGARRRRRYYRCHCLRLQLVSPNSQSPFARPGFSARNRSPLGCMARAVTVPCAARAHARLELPESQQLYWVFRWFLEMSSVEAQQRSCSSHRQCFQCRSVCNCRQESEASVRPTVVAMAEAVATWQRRGGAPRAATACKHCHVASTDCVA